MYKSCGPHTGPVGWARQPLQDGEMPRAAQVGGGRPLCGSLILPYLLCCWAVLGEEGVDFLSLGCACGVRAGAGLDEGCPLLNFNQMH